MDDVKAECSSVKHIDQFKKCCIKFTKVLANVKMDTTQFESAEAVEALLEQRSFKNKKLSSLMLDILNTKAEDLRELADILEKNKITAKKRLVEKLAKLEAVEDVKTRNFLLESILREFDNNLTYNQLGESAMGKMEQLEKWDNKMDIFYDAQSELGKMEEGAPEVAKVLQNVNKLRNIFLQNSADHKVKQIAVFLKNAELGKWYSIRFLCYTVDDGRLGHQHSVELGSTTNWHEQIHQNEGVEMDFGPRKKVRKCKNGLIYIEVRQLEDRV